MTIFSLNRDGKVASLILNSRTLSSADIDSDHNLLYADVCLKLKRLKKSRTIDKYDLESIKAPDIQERYAVEIKKPVSTTDNSRKDPDEIWCDI